jgi:catechol 2,3-dioxygenase-like lactoylglutathione lyase family enzyme
MLYQCNRYLSMSLRYVMLLQRDVPKAARFYSEGLGLPLKVLTDRWAELDSGGTTIALKAADG